MQWLNGDFNECQELTQSENLKQLQDEFMSAIDFSNLTTQQLGLAAQVFLNDAGYVVVFNDYLEPIDEAMSRQEAKDFIKLLRKEKEVKFKYKKAKDGTIRKAKGTLDPETIHKGLSSSDIDAARKRRHIPSTIIIYWDLDKEMFRSFRKVNFISITSS